MARRKAEATDLEAINAQRERLRQELAKLEAAAKAAELAAMDAGRTPLLTALDRVKIPAMDKGEAKLIARAISQHGAKAVANCLITLSMPA
ncbi:hypothetical protein FHW92_004800 [Novosphingobium sp. SG707]|nr:hypothetical protein [Novosphingobium sp. SG707]